MDDLIIAAAKAGTGKMMVELNSSTEDEALGITVFTLRRRLSAAILLANANLLDNRIRFVLGNNAAALQRRKAASVRFAGTAVKGHGDFTTEFLTYSGKLSGGSLWSELAYLG